MILVTPSLGFPVGGSAVHTHQQGPFPLWLQSEEEKEQRIETPISAQQAGENVSRPPGFKVHLQFIGAISPPEVLPLGGLCCCLVDN